MTQLFEGITRVISIGVGATVVLDIWIYLLKQLHIPSLNFAFLGRWIGHLLRGQWAHDGIARAGPIKRELLLGWSAHYAIGIAFAAILVSACGLEWARAPSLLPALCIGIGTVVAPLFVMQPAMGAGIASSKTSAPILNCIKSLTNHAVFGVGLYLAAVATDSFILSPDI
jgi:hypothetical protein